MRKARLLPWFLGIAPLACSVYDPSLLEDDLGNASGGARATGGRASGGKQISNGGSPTSGGKDGGGPSADGGRAVGGRSSGGASPGGAPSDGGADTASGGDESSGGDSNSGGASDGGRSSGGANSGGATSGGASSGGASSGGASSGGASSGGAPMLEGPGPWLIDDLSTGENYSRSIFTGYWERYAEMGATWTAETIPDMIQPRPDDVANPALRVAATTLNEWGVDVRITLNGGGDYLDLTGHTGIQFVARSMVSAPNRVRGALEDSVSNYTTCDASTSCDKHIESSVLTTISSASYTTVKLPFSGFTSKPSPRTGVLDLSKVFAIHIKMDPDPADTAVDFYIDDISLY